MGQPLNYLFQNDLEKVSGRETADQKLYNAVKDRLPFVKWLGDYEEETTTSKT